MNVESMFVAAWWACLVLLLLVACVATFRWLWITALFRVHLRSWDLRDWARLIVTVMAWTIFVGWVLLGIGSHAWGVPHA